jgi:hypothetical protein
MSRIIRWQPPHPLPAPQSAVTSSRVQAPLAMTEATRFSETPAQEQTIMARTIEKLKVILKKNLVDSSFFQKP